jgi:ATP-dependent DNA helicase RecQ
VLALTATAAPRVREEIVQRLGMRNPRVVVRGFDRPNLRLAVERFQKEAAKTAALLRRVAAADKPGIVYVATRRQAEDVASALVESGLRADAYHAGMRPADRESAQSRFMDGGSQVIVATSAFGMGIDKPDVRFVFHHHVSESLDAYYQEVGRGGRDGEPAEAILFYRPENLGLRRFFASGGRVDEEQIAQVAEAIRELAGPVHPRELAEQMDFSGAKLASALTSLEQVGLVERLADGHVRPAEPELETDEAMEEAARIHRRRRNLDLTRIEMMKGYAEAPGCRRKFVLDYFGEGFDPPCGRCDNCEAGAEVLPDDAERPFPLQSRVAHPEWGEGVVLRYEEDRVTVLFEEEGYKTLAVPVVLERRLLERAG